MKDFRLAIVAVIWADTPKSAIEKKRETFRKQNWKWNEKISIIILINFIEMRHSQTSL